MGAGSFKMAIFSTSPYNSLNGSSFRFFHSRRSSILDAGVCNGADDAEGTLLSLVGGGNSALLSAIRRRGMNPGRVAVPPITRIFPDNEERRSIGSFP